MAIWADLIRLIRSREYFPREHETRETRKYCTNVIDVHLLDALDLLYALDDEADNLSPDYERIFVPTYTGSDCRCPTCHGAAEHWGFLLDSADHYHGFLPQELFDRIFTEIFVDDDEPRAWL